MSQLERTSQRKKPEVDRTRRVSTVNMTLNGPSSLPVEAGEKSLTNAVSSLSVHPAEKPRERETSTHLHPNPNGITTNGAHPGPNAPNKEIFLNYFFGAQPQRSGGRPSHVENRPAGHSQDVAKEMIMPKTVLDGEPLSHDRKFDHMTESDESPHLSEREDMETQLIRKSWPSLHFFCFVLIVHCVEPKLIIASFYNY